MNPTQIHTIEAIRQWSLSHIQRDTSKSGCIWHGTWTFLKYILALPPSELELIALHAAHFGGHSPLAHMENSGIDTTEIRQLTKHRLIKQYKKLTRNLPEAWRLSEFEIANSPIQKGLRHDDRIIGEDLLRYQQAVANLYSFGIFDDISEFAPRVQICEVGAGYGLLAGCLTNTINNLCYTIIDLPQTLFTAGVYLTLNCPDKSIYLVDEESSPDTILEKSMSHDFILCPASLFSKLSSISFNFALNTFSFQEMSEETVANYARFFSQNPNGYLYSDNWSKHPWNTEIHTSVEAILAQHYHLYPSPERYTREDIQRIFPVNSFGAATKPFIGIPHGKNSTKVMRHIFLLNGVAEISFHDASA
jgi:putative sugar O-methyltransferase